jgi:hypothetical protein
MAALVTGGPAPEQNPQPAGPQQATGPAMAPSFGSTSPPRLQNTEDITAGRGGGGGLTMSVGYDEQRSRDQPTSTASALASGTHRTVTLSTSFSPTSNWAVSWQTLYDLTNNQFGQHILRLDRDLRRWRATFSFLKSPNGNFAFNFNIVLLDESEIKFRYDQQSVGNR